MSKHVPFIATASVHTPVAVSSPISFEGLLYYSRSLVDGIQLDTKLDCITYRDGMPAVSASAFFGAGLSGISLSTTITMSRVDLKGIAADMIDVDESMPVTSRSIGDMSKYRNRRTSYPTLNGVKSVAWCGIGDPEEISVLLDYVKGVGAIVNRGYGAVTEWQVTPVVTEVDTKTFGWYKGDALLRRLPLETVAKHFDGQLPKQVSIDLDRVEPPMYLKEGRIQVASPTLEAMKFPVGKPEAFFI